MGAPQGQPYPQANPAFGAPPPYALTPYGGQPGVPAIGRQTSGRAAKAIFAALFALLIAVAGGIVGGILVSATGAQSGSTSTLPGRGGAIADVAAEVKASVVSIGVRASGQEGTGSGVIVSKGGLVLT
ncbi:MAG: hypothetical protein ACRDT8_26070, partial [Micromonosporaceae bacterium]